MDEKVLLEWKEAPAYVYCLCCYLLFDNGEGRLADAIADKVEKPDAQEILDAVQEYRRFLAYNPLI